MSHTLSAKISERVGDSLNSYKRAVVKLKQVCYLEVNGRLGKVVRGADVRTGHKQLPVRRTERIGNGRMMKGI